MLQKLITGLLLTFLFFNVSNAQNLLNHGYAYGTLPTNINTNDITSAYTTWKNTFTESCGDDRIRVKFDDRSQTVSEGIGYGMLIAAYAGDQDLLDGLWNYYTAFLNNNGVMNWKINGCSSAIGFNGATDAELDAAMALIIAHHRWGSTGTVNYENDANNLITTIKTHEIELGTNVLKPGDVWGGSEATNISYFAPGYYRAYNTHTNDASWNAVASISYDIIDANQSKTGAVYNLVSDWCKADGNFSTEVVRDNNGDEIYGYDAARTPWRIVLDYLWYGTTNALTYSNKCIDFINAKNGLDNIYPGYKLDGTPAITSYKDVVFTGAYATAAMASTDQAFVNEAYTKTVAMATDAYFGSTLRVLYLLTMSGNFYSPKVFSTLNTSDYNEANEVLLYPNPVLDTLTINFDSNNDSNTIKIYTMEGKLVTEKEYTGNKTSINIEGLSSGIYVIYINNSKHQFIKK